MSSHFTIDVERKLVLKTHIGDISEASEIEILNAVLGDPTYRKGMSFYCDFTRATVNWSMAEIEHFRGFVAKLKHLTGRCRWAVVFPPDSDTRTAQTFIDLHATFNDTIEVQLFTSRDEAVRWLNEESTDTQKIVIESAQES